MFDNDVTRTDCLCHVIAGMLTITDFIQILQKYYKSPQVRHHYHRLFPIVYTFISRLRCF